MTNLLVAIILVIAIVAIVWFLVKQLSVLLVNAVLGLICLFLINFLHIMEWMGKSDLGYGLTTLLICAIGGLPGVLILMLLSILGISI
ncbi:MAG: pro-sigmaK processing inhibitor BofA family protein [Methanoregula sp.]|jgi:inhibitor of the pro-sigma K processing machinery|uniref:pro-sigmaK processing inhibitor BofA family protein n=1 Tax=Methanoregula sp. TaxID=2052170 RepID=UPI0025D360CA|nr:pro-sigmaK processing inhibitor BofA family protein [Methanoregula sp.]MCK9631471.1 pro-sigmaK processing inhibitor BofA family protein [Methanoregula sp.]